LQLAAQVTYREAEPHHRSLLGPMGPLVYASGIGTAMRREYTKTVDEEFHEESGTIALGDHCAPFRSLHSETNK
jgi:hypothetical protein